MNQYTSSELDEFRTLIETRLSETEAELKNLNEQINELRDSGTRAADSSFSSLDEAANGILKEDLSANAFRIKKYILSLRSALIRVENGTYGICQVTGKKIPKERLRAVPNTTKSIEGKLGSN